MFVVTLISGRVNPQDVAVVNLVLKAAKEIKVYGLIFNSLTKRVKKSFESLEEKMAELIVQFTLQENGNSTATPFPVFLPKIEELEDTDDVTVQIKVLENFINGLPYIKVCSTNVANIEADISKKLVAKYERQMNELLNDKKALEIKIQEEREKYEARMEALIKEERVYRST